MIALRVWAVVSCLFALASCVQPGHTKPFTAVFVIGDTLSDNGTFKPVTLTGKFTNTPGRIWAESVAAHFGTLLKPAYTFDGTQFSRQQGGTNYAQAGARIASSDGLFQGVSKPIEWQVSQVLGDQGSDLKGALVLIDGGGPDLAIMGFQYSQGRLTKEEVFANAKGLAHALVQQLERVADANPRKVVLLSVKDYGKTPMFGAGSSDMSSFMTTLCRSFNEAVLQQAAARTLGAHIVDASAHLEEVRSNPSAYGLVNIAEPNVDPELVQSTSAGFSANSTREHLISPGADQTYMYADTLHFSARLHDILAEYVITEIK